MGDRAEAQTIALCRLQEIPDGRARGFRVPRGQGELHVFVVRRGEAAWAYLNACPHVGTPLDWAPDEFLDREGRYLVCATHGARFRVEDGVCLAGPCEGDRLQALPLEIRDGVVYLGVARPAE